MDSINIKACKEQRIFGNPLQGLRVAPEQNNVQRTRMSENEGNAKLRGLVKATGRRSLLGNGELSFLFVTRQIQDGKNYKDSF